MNNSRMYKHGWDTGHRTQDVGQLVVTDGQTLLYFQLSMSAHWYCHSIGSPGLRQNDLVAGLSPFYFFFIF